MGIRQNIVKLRELFGITQEQLANIAGVSRGAVSQWEGGFSEPRMGSIQKIADHFHIAKSNIIEDGGMDQIDPVTKRPVNPVRMPKGAMPVYSSGEATVPMVTLGRVHAGELTDEEAVEQRIDVPASLIAGHRRSFAFTVEGDCMNRVVQDGDHALVDPDMTPRNGSIVVAETEAYQAIMRRWYRGRNTLLLVADSYEDYEDIVFTEDDGPVKVLGVVFWWQAPREME